MREILFRGKRVYNSEWVEGYLVKLGRESFSYPERYGICNKAIPLGGSGVFYNLKIDEVIPETVGQYTGLTDKNGKKIFEGDVVVFCGIKGTVVWKGHKFYVESNLLWDFSDDCIEVIGNIHDNPKLLKGGDGDG